MHQKWMLARMQDIIAPPGVTAAPGSLVPDRIEAVAEAMREAGLITSFPPYEAFYADLAK
jgi:hypothetical protein